MAGYAKRSDIVTFIDITPASSPTWAIVGDYSTDGTLTYDATTSEDHFITKDSPTINIDTYGVSMDQEQYCYVGDEVFDYIDNLRITRATGDDTRTHYLNVYKYNVSNNAYKAEMGDCTITINSIGGAGNEKPRIGYTINMEDNTIGTATISEGVPTFTPDNVSL